MIHQIEWRTASPLWEEALKDKTDTRVKQPAILRFASDTFMEDLESVLDTDPSALKDLMAQYETWKEEGAGWIPDEEYSTESPIRLYQPAHGRFYLVAANLVCRTPGLPDRFVDTANEEKVSFLLRRQVANGDGSNGSTEYGWVTDDENMAWERIPSGEESELLENEERLPLFSKRFSCPRQAGMQRRLWLGLIPVGSRETFQAAPESNLFNITEEERANDDLGDPRLAEFESHVVEGVKGIVKALPTPRITLQEAQISLLFVCLDLATFLDQYLHTVWEEVQSGTVSSVPFDDLDKANSFCSGKTWAQALKSVYEQGKTILSGAAEDSENTTSFITDELTNLQAVQTAIDNLGILDHNDEFMETFKEDLKTALGSYDQSIDMEEPPELPKLDPNAGIAYVLRCVYERPHCKGIHPPVVSAPSQLFQLSTFFDPEAPTRPVRITMPVDTSISGLRRFRKNVSFLISNKLRRQIDRIQGIKVTDLENGDIGSDQGFNLGVICSFSIPIITICALILLMIIVFLLNIVFWWLPFFKICFPINLKSR